MISLRSLATELQLENIVSEQSSNLQQDPPDESIITAMKIVDELIGSASGKHDLESVSLRTDTDDMVFVSMHEGLHDSLLNDTPFGLVQVVLKSLLELSEDYFLKDILKMWTQLSFEVSKHSHERYATYLSIKTLPLDQHEIILAKHPIHYRKYYSEVSNLVDPIFKSSFLQFIVGKVLIEVCFASLLIVRLHDWTPELEISIDQSEMPDTRFKNIASYFTRIKMQELLNFLYVEYKQEAKDRYSQKCDFNNEEDWLALSSQESSRLDDFLLMTVRKWIYNQVSNIWPCLFPDEWIISQQKFIENMSAKTGIRIHSKTEKAKKVELVRELKVYLRNAGILWPLFTKLHELRPPPSDFDAIRFFITSIQSAGKAFFLSCPPQEWSSPLLPTWVYRVYVKNYNEHLTTNTSMCHDQLKDILLFNKSLAYTSGFVFEYSGMVIRPGYYREGNIWDIYNDFLDYHVVRTVKGVSVINANSVFWYIDGSMLDWYNTMLYKSDQGSVQFSNIHFNSNLVIFVTLFDDCIGFFFRVLSIPTFARLYELIKQEGSESGITEIHLSQELVDKFARITSEILITWRNL